MRRGILTSAKDVGWLRQVNGHRDPVLVILEWLIAEASRLLEGLAHAVRREASGGIVVKEADNVGHLCQIIAEGYVMP